MVNPAKAEEIFQMIFLKLHKSRHRFNPEYPFVPWLFAVAHSVLVDSLRRKTIEVLEPCPDVMNNHPIESVGFEFLNEDQNELLTLRYVHDLSFKQISERLQSTPDAIRKRLSRLIQFLRHQSVIEGKS